MIKAAIEAAKAAGDIQLKHYRKVKTITKKGAKDFFTNVDIACEKAIITIIRKSHPNHSFLSEEAGSIDAGSGYLWIIDPLDGTHNYIHGLPEFGVSIGLEKDGELQIGVIYLPINGKLYCAEKGKGAFLNGKRIHVSEVKSLGDALMLQEGVLHRKVPHKLTFLGKALKTVFKVRMLGSAAVAFGSVAEGTSDVLVTFETNPWDVAAGFLLVREAGGSVTDFKGNPIDHYASRFIATNSSIHGETVALCRKF
ncbi:TPA: inositol monophosphatase [Candidatus Woesearchaeota archaeon]|nr:inositol monophosphatase [Candidatus Woesearchaeota archaeon]HII68645.1 inositol monophosphatase [Candidatus Woesearchaeota archaeon]